MKTFITLYVVCLVGAALATPIELSDEQKAKAKDYILECMKFHNKDIENPSKTLKCLGTCFFERSGIMKNGELQDNVVLTKLGGLVGDAEAKQILEKCKGIKDENRCETGFKTFLCLHAEIADI
ncbi:general odorant-binding protein 56a-like [Musca autumnalis]|uniref:general odorant-binding protein 56a-like n=1 Tax=Musca autumnalis TaxID=221902 RepID=UPI003CFB47C2